MPFLRCQLEGTVASCHSVYGLVVLVGLFNIPTIDADMVFAVVVAQMQAVVVFWSHETRMHRGKKLVMV